MKKLVFTLGMLVMPFSYMAAVVEIPLSTSQPNDEHDIEDPIGRSSVRVPKIGIEGCVLQRLQLKMGDIYYVDIVQNGVIKFSSIWNFQQKYLHLPDELFGEFDVILKNDNDCYWGRFWIN